MGHSKFFATTPAGFLAMLGILTCVMWLSMVAFHASGNTSTIKISGGVALAMAIVLGPKVIWRLAIALFIGGMAARFLSDVSFGTIVSAAGLAPKISHSLFYAFASTETSIGVAITISRRAN